MDSSMKKYVLVSGFCLTENNRGTAALGYGTLGFLKQKGYINNNREVAFYSVTKKPFRKTTRETVNVSGETFACTHFYVNIFEYKLWKKFGLLIPFLSLSKIVRKLALVAAINGGDGFSDIYGKKI